MAEPKMCVPIMKPERFPQVGFFFFKGIKDNDTGIISPLQNEKFRDFGWFFIAVA